MSAASLPISIADLRKTYGHYVALDDVTLDIAAGEFLTLLGPSGSGKTTLLMALAGFVRPERGALTIGGRDVILRDRLHGHLAAFDGEDGQFLVAPAGVRRRQDQAVADVPTLGLAH